MKKLILIFALIIAFNVNAQHNYQNDAPLGESWDLRVTYGGDPTEFYCFRVYDTSRAEPYVDTLDFRRVSVLRLPESNTKYLRGDGSFATFPSIPDAEPIGSGQIYFGSSAPSGWLMCDGSAINRTTYAALFAIIGTTYGVGNGSTTFNLPDLRQRFPIGKGASGTGSSIGETGGNIDHTHSVDPPNITSTSNGSHNHTGVTGTPSATVAATILVGGAASTTHTHTISSDGSHTHDSNIGSFNSGTNNPPYLTVNFIIKY